MPSVADIPFTFIGLDIHKDSISACILEPGVADSIHDKIFHDEPSIRRLMGRFEPATLRVCYEAGADRHTGWPGWRPRWRSTARSSPRR